VDGQTTWSRGPFRPCAFPRKQQSLRGGPKAGLAPAGGGIRCQCNLRLSMRASSWASTTSCRTVRKPLKHSATLPAADCRLPTADCLDATTPGPARESSMGGRWRTRPCHVEGRYPGGRHFTPPARQRRRPKAPGPKRSRSESKRGRHTAHRADICLHATLGVRDGQSTIGEAPARLAAAGRPKPPSRLKAPPLSRLSGSG
jgi:hypothetical protein